jgi:probable rRNA maturation factor
MSEWVDVYDETNQLSDAQMNLLKEMFEFARTYLDVNPYELAVTFVENDKIQSLNREYRDKDSVTDVLSFSMADEEESIDDLRVYGDIVISFDRAKEQAVDFGHSLNREICFLSLHGFLHLLGFDHETKEMEEEMILKQKEILDAFGVIR